LQCHHIRRGRHNGYILKFRLQPSIQNKVKAGYYICLALIVVVSILNYLDLKRIDKKISFSLIISDLFDTTLEMRRFEKNYFLYRDKEDYTENLRFTEKAEDIIRQNKEAIKRLARVRLVHIGTHVEMDDKAQTIETFTTVKATVLGRKISKIY